MILLFIATFCLGVCAGAIYAYLDCGKEIQRRLADGRLVERV